MSGTITALQQAALQTIGTTAGALAAGSAVSLGVVDARTGGNMANLFSALFTLTAQWGTVTGITALSTVADLYLVPAIDDAGPTYPDIDLTVGAAVIPFTMRAGPFVAAKAPTASANMLFQSGPVELQPMLYNAYILNRTTQTMATGAVLKARGAAAQYT